MATSSPLQTSQDFH